MQISRYLLTDGHNYHSTTTALTLRAMRMMRLVRFRERTSLLVEALETTSRAVSSRGALSAAVRARKEKIFIFKNYIR